ncbi:MAG: hypothetical protein ACXW0Z_05240 [Gemmatirosa sp.]
MPVPRVRPRRRSLLAVLALAAVAAGGCRERPTISRDDATQIAAAEQAMDALRATARTDDSARTPTGRAAAPPLDAAGARALLYLERARLGLGSPFQLAEQAQQDSALGRRMGRTVAWALLGRAAAGESYTVDPAALSDPVDPWRPGALVDGRLHRRLIDSTVAAAPSARTGEATVRLAYALARAERLVTPRIAESAVPAAALSRDRRLARADAARLLRASAEAKVAADSDALALLSQGRKQRRLASERPLLGDDLRPDQASAARDAERLLGELRAHVATALVSTEPDTSQLSDSTVAMPTVAASGAAALACAAPDLPLPCRTAARLAAMEVGRGARPDPYVTITLGGFRSTAAESGLERDSIVSEDDPVLVQRLAARARTADGLAIEWARARVALPADGPAHRRLARLVHAVAVSARPFAQATVATPGTPDRDVQAVADRMRIGSGIAKVAFDRGLPAAWRVPALLELEGAVADLRLALPALTLDGLAVRIGASPKGDLALALHDPTSRTIFLPPASGAGTIAHELAHDLDWQAARTQLGLRGTYATDRAARLGAEPLATAVRGLADTRARAGARGTPAVDRPAELFARGADWFVAAMLAREGRMNGALTSVQDAELPGFAGAAVPTPGTGAADAILEALGRVTPLSPVSVQWFRARFGAEAPMPASAVARLALDAGSAWGAERTFTGLGLPAGLSAHAPSGGIGTARGTCPLAPWQRRLLWVAADARARGMLRGQAARAQISGFQLWQSRATLGAPWQQEVAAESHRRFRDAVVRAALRDLRARVPFADVATCD